MEIENTNGALSAEEYLGLKKATAYSGAAEEKIRELVLNGGLPGSTVGANPTEGYRIPKSALDAAVASGLLKPRRVYRVKSRAQAPKFVPSERITLKEAAERFGIGYSTVQKKVQDGVLPSERVQIGPHQHQRYVDAADVAALNITRHTKGRPRRGRPPMMPALRPTPSIPATNLTAELLRAADMVRDGKYRVVKLVIALEFNGGE